MEVENTMNTTVDPEAKAKMEKLRLEVEELQWKVRWAYKVGQFVSVVTAFLAIGAILVSIYQINAAYQQDFKKPVWEKQLRILSDVSETAAAIAVLPAGSDERQKAELKFEQLYWGPVAITENQELKDLMREFTECINGRTPVCDCYVPADPSLGLNTVSDCSNKKTKLQELSLGIANECRVKVGGIWGIEALISSDQKSSDTSPTPTATPTPEATELP
jgi:hypothetical protein